MNARCSPGRVLCRHAKDQRADFLAHWLSTANLLRSGEPSPIQAKAGAMPLHDGSRCDQNQRLFPSLPQPPQNHPEELVPGRQSMAGMLSLHREKLLPKSQILQDEILT